MTTDNVIKNVIKIEDAKELKALGLPILPVVDKTYSMAAEKFFIDAEKSKTRFYRAFVEYCQIQMPTRFNRMRKAIETLDSILNKVATYESSDDENSESLAVNAWFTMNVDPFVAYWKDVLVRAENGEPIQVNLQQENFEGWAIP